MFIDERLSIDVGRERYLEIAQFFQSEEYDSRCQRLRDALAGITGKTIAVDLERTLVTPPMMVSTHGTIQSGLKGKTGIIPEHFALMRPLADVFLDQLVDQRNKVVLWTAAGSVYILELLMRCRFDAALLRRCQLLTSNKYAKFQRKVLSGSDLALLDKIRQEKGLTEIRAFKIPRHIRADALIDDAIHSIHRDACKAISPSDIRRLVPISPFEFESVADLRDFHQDQELLRIVEELRGALKRSWGDCLRRFFDFSPDIFHTGSV